MSSTMSTTVTANGIACSSLDRHLMPQQIDETCTRSPTLIRLLLIVHFLLHIQSLCSKSPTLIRLLLIAHFLLKSIKVRLMLFEVDETVVKKAAQSLESSGLLHAAGITTSLSNSSQQWNSENPWTGYKPVSVAWTVNVDKVLCYIKSMLMVM
ncbi:hypothetical protein Tco_1483286 [Tanacetum coccineum]